MTVVKSMYEHVCMLQIPYCRSFQFSSKEKSKQHIFILEADQTFREERSQGNTCSELYLGHLSE